MGKVHTLDTFFYRFSMSKEFLSLKDLTLYTDHSLLQGDLTFHLDKETKWQDFNNKVNWEMKMKREVLFQVMIFPILQQNGTIIPPSIFREK